ncbi:MAG: protein phosphatase 2C domain-containing protein [Pseudomonadota bacterium]|nr:protein phosphatase 2C domain-containing protein [Pseudomonadota bacterium]
MPYHSPFHIDLAAHSSVGTGFDARLENQDNYLTIDTEGMAAYLVGQEPCRRRVPGWPPGHVRVAVLDGMGGHGHGREAAEAVVAGLLYLPAFSDLDALETALDALHTTLQQAFAGEAGRRPGTTLTLLEIPPGTEGLLYHVGDSRLYQVLDGAIEPLTIDHVPATNFAMDGALGEQEWWQQVHGEHRPQISQAFLLGNAFANPRQLGDALFPLTPANLPPWLAALADRRVMTLVPDATYLLATDGFWSCPQALAWVARWPGIMQDCADGATAVAALFAALETAPPAGMHPDNATAVVCRLLPVSAGAADETALPQRLLDENHAQ